MRAIWQDIRSGHWLTPGRLRSYALILVVAYAAAAALWIGLSDGLIDRNGKPLGTDFSNVYAAGTLAQAGDAAAAYDWARAHAAEKTVFNDPATPFYGWHYPPFFLIVAALLALLPYGGALALWMAATLPAYLLAIRSIVPQPPAMLVALAFPAVFVNLGHGQNGFLSAALLGGALVLLNPRPALAGVLIGLLAYKPQFGVLIPLVLLATGRWRVIAAAGATVLAASAATLALFGTQVWTAFAGSTALTRSIVLEAGDTGWEKIQSLFAALRLWGGGLDAAYAAQATLAVGVAAILVWLWRSEAAYELKAGALAVASLLATPYVLDYDLMLLAVALAFYARHGLARGFRPYEITLLALVWCAPLFARAVAQSAGIPLGFVAQFVLFALIVDRARHEVRALRRSESLAPA